MATLKPPPAQHRSAPTGPPKAPVKADPTTTIADTAVFQGKHLITIGANTVIHPRARFYSYDGPIIIGDGCIISEKAVIGTQPASTSRSRPSTPTTPTSTDEHQHDQDSTIRVSYFVTIGPQSTIRPGAHIHSSACIEALAIINRHAEIGSHTKICSGVQVPEGSSVPEWTVVWGNGIGQRRRRAREAKMPGPAVVIAAKVTGSPVPGAAPEGRVIEDARLMVLQKEREVLGRMIIPAGAKKR
ncbi:uncharacterized protein N7484_011081 [Penicillium longicatenatum]|uniref:uncharacterized protein n=1 Tax=Penicillium longicatenatum TaxID=1561947 RepID=UPI002548D144|nr:uncharacterized protein N7484_011081 [Penicillium longicatenatum]KAJ5630981.1 hypothetical protein N7484_011081 [Penicillium longicatenatum]